MTIPVLIAPFQTGLDTDIEPWLAPLDSFRTLNNFHVKNGYIQKRAGIRRFGYFVVNPVATITNVTQANPAVVTAANTFANGEQVLITNVQGMTELNGNIYTVANRTAADFELQGVDSTGFSAYTLGGRAAKFTADRIMGIYRYYNPDGSKSTLAFDTKRAAIYNGVSDRFDPLDNNDIMSGSETDYIWVENWQHSDSTNRLYFTNGKAYDGASVDGIRYYDSGVSTTATTLFTPSLGGTRTLYGCKLIFAIKQRLVVLNTFEYDSSGATTTNYPQRARWCQAQSPSNWDDTVAGGGGFVDAPTGQQIISARALQDVIIVFFSDSVWTLRPVPDPALPFRWDKINDFRACDGKMATIGYDRYVVAFGVRGITATDGVETRRVDDRIQNFTSDEVNVGQFKKVYCARNYDNKRMWTLYTGSEDNSTENNKALIFDDDSKAFSEYEIDMNCLGYGNFFEDYGLDDFIAENDLDIALNQLDEETLQSFFWQENQEAFLGGSIDGIVYVMQTETSDDGANISCEAFTNAWNPFEKEGTEVQLQYLDIYIETEKNTQIEVEFYKDTDESPYATRQSDLLPPLDYISSVSNITQANPAVVTADGHGLSTGDTIYIYGVRGMTEISGEYTITVVDENNFSLDGIDSTAFTAFTTNGQVVRNQYYRTKSWKRIIAGGIGFQHRVRITSTGVNSPLQIYGFKPYFKKRGKRTIN